MAFSIIPERQDELLNGGYSQGCPVWWKTQGHLIPAIFIYLRYDNRAGIAIQGVGDEWTSKHVRLRNISKRVPR